MKTINIGNSGICASEIALGCMRITGLSFDKAAALIRTALDQGIDFFDHADVYAEGQAEETFGKIIKSESISRSKIYLQTKCGIRDGYFDFSKEHIRGRRRQFNASADRLRRCSAPAQAGRACGAGRGRRGIFHTACQR